MVERVAEDGAPHASSSTPARTFATQMLAAGVTRIDAVVYTHPHADHIHGIDDLRGFWLEQRSLIDIHADVPTLARLQAGLRLLLRDAAGQFLSADPACRT